LSLFSEKRFAWFLLALSSLALESTALYFQYGMGLQPCVLCVYERLAIIGLFIAGIIGLLAPKSFIVRLWTALFIYQNGAVREVAFAISDF